MSFKCIELKKDKENKLESLEIGLTSWCNFRCTYCCAYQTDDTDFLSPDKIIHIIDDLPDLKRIKLSGGEVLGYFDECLQVIDYCTSRGIAVQVNTNGSLLDRQKIRQLEKAGLEVLHFSLNFTNSKDFKKYYHVEEKVFHRIKNNIIISTQCSSMDTVVETILFKETENNMGEIYRFIYGLGVRKHEIQYGIPIDKKKWYEISSGDRLLTIIDLLTEIKKQDSKIFFSCIDLTPCSPIYQKLKKNEDKTGIYFPSCIEGRKQLHLHNNGDILICELGYPAVIGNVFKGTRLKDIFTDMPPILEKFRESHNCGKNYTFSPNCGNIEPLPIERMEDETNESTYAAT